MAINKYQEKSQEVEIHPSSHVTIEDDEYGNYDECQCSHVTTVQAQYDFAGSHRVRVELDKFNTFRSDPVWMTPDNARALAAALCFAANDADQLNKDFPND
jgi:hypothetical protein